MFGQLLHWPGSVFTTQDMHMDMKNRLSCFCPVIINNSEAIANTIFYCNLRADTHKLANEFFVLLGDIGRIDNMFFGNNKKVDGSLWGYISETL